MRNDPGTQRGITAIGWLIVLILIGFFALVAMKLIPIYIEYYQVAKVLTGVEGDKSLAKGPIKEIVRRIDHNLYINSVSRVTVRKHLKVTKEKEGLVATITYDARVPMFANVELIAHFNKSVVVGSGA
jgi:hypothetical protein